MQTRLNYLQIAPETMKLAVALETHLAKSGLEQSLYHLVKTRASQINGCAFCIHMHTRDARAHGETEERLYLLDAWRESPLYSDRERAALAWTESLTLIAETRAPDDVFEPRKTYGVISIAGRVLAGSEPSCARAELVTASPAKTSATTRRFLISNSSAPPPAHLPRSLRRRDTENGLRAGRCHCGLVFPAKVSDSPRPPHGRIAPEVGR